MKKELVWNVWCFPGSWSKGEPHNPEVVNVFNLSRSFNTSLYKLKRKKIADKKEFEEELRRILSYSFWGRCEYEHLIVSWPPIKNESGYKTDVYEQVRLNWDHFVDYVWENQKLIKKCV